MKRTLLFVLLSVGTLLHVVADEGMWLPIHIARLNQTDMQKMGLQLTAEEIYSINHSSLKDAIVNLGGGFCTGEIISKEGLLLTNHHCGYDVIQQHSTVENDILTNGFWAQSKQDELPNEGLFVQFLVRMEDVTEKVLKTVKGNMTSQERSDAIDKIIAQLSKEAKGNTHYDIRIRSFFEGNEYYMFVYETFNDVRLVGNPPESIGKFGGDTDNWMWPRHTGDFSLFRVYSAPDGKPAKYSPENIPLKPKHYLPISLDGVRENDFAMVLGYPGTTNRYLNSFGVKQTIESTNPARVKIRGTKLEIMKSYMDQDPAVRLAYSSKYASISNYWKYFIGQTNGLKKLDVYNKKVAIENELTDWILDKSSRQKKYGNPVKEIETAYINMDTFNLPYYYHIEAGLGVEFIRSNGKLSSLLSDLQNAQTDEARQNAVEKLKMSSEKFFKDYDAQIDRDVLEAMARYFVEDIDAEFVPKAFLAVNPGAYQNFIPGFVPQKQVDTKAFADFIFENSMLVNEAKMMAFYADPSAGILENDPGYMVVNSVFESYRDISAKRGSAIGSLESGRRNFVAALRDMNDRTKYYPDANSTMRLTYGKVLSYDARDAVHYHYLTTLKGIMEKEDPSNPEFIVHPKLKELYKNADFGPYGENGKLYVGFLTNNDITGGNSGSPVINSKGQLIGCAFDGNWEAMSGDTAFEPDLQRCINVDIRYVLFIIDKFADAHHLIDEMTIIKEGVIRADVQ
ncbi:MAG: S46 family peptidase [Cyclobacteriaceae bacterium]|nr:S46 family peptidase [Cyclobacteriaceae bacterium]